MGFFNKTPDVVEYEIFPPTFIRRKVKEPVSLLTEGDDLVFQRMMGEIIRTWCIDNEFIIGGRTRLSNSPVHLPSIFYQLNFRTLVIDANFDKLITVLHDTEADRTLSRILELYVNIVTTIDPLYLKKMVNKLYRSLEVVTPPNDADWGWSELHTTLPYLWVIYQIQCTLRQHPPIKTTA